MKPKNLQQRRKRLTFEQVAEAIADQGRLARRPDPKRPGHFKGFLIYIPNRERPITYTYAYGVKQIKVSDEFGLQQALDWAEYRRSAAAAPQGDRRERALSLSQQLKLAQRRVGKNISWRLVVPGDRIRPVDKTTDPFIKVLSQPKEQNGVCIFMGQSLEDESPRQYEVDIESRWNLLLELPKPCAIDS